MLSQDEGCQSESFLIMATFISSCPNTNQQVQGLWSAKDIAKHGGSCIPVQCKVCGGLHYINPLSGRVLGNDDGVDSGDGEDQASRPKSPENAGHGRTDCFQPPRCELVRFASWQPGMDC